jgi:gamma-glutamylcyclotransferase (GGCT)/AIG2-like uncharacterized protein YtfP
VGLIGALEDFNRLRWAGSTDRPWVERLDRLAQATFRAAEHLIVYGSLSPGGPNHWRLAPLGGTWEPGWVEGERLREHWGELDRYEGPAYQRILATFHSDGASTMVGYLYAAAPGR